MDKLFVVVTAYAVVQPEAMVVEFLTAAIACLAVLSIVLYNLVAKVAFIVKEQTKLVFYFHIILVKSLDIYSVVSRVSSRSLVPISDHCIEYVNVQYGQNYLEDVHGLESCLLTS